MYQSKKSVLIFGVGPLQESIIARAKKMGLYTVGIDPCEDATCRDCVDAFEVVPGQDYEGHCAVIEKYSIDAIVTAATDKPLGMMARLAEKYGFPFYSVETAQWSTDKFQMKERFELGGVPHAQGRLISKVEEAEGLVFPVIVKPRDNSGSRGVKLCRDKNELQISIDEALENSKLDTVLVEEFIEGPEYSIESLHHDGKSEVIQFTEKKTTEFPYNVELGHIQPANISEESKQKIREIVTKIGKALKFENCPSHTELKINERGIFVVETSPRLGGDYITSMLTPLSTGINMEDQLLHIALGENVDTQTGRIEKASGVCFLNLPCGKVTAIDPAINGVSTWQNVYSFATSLKVGDEIHPITSSLNRYGQFIVHGRNREEINRLIESYEHRIYSFINVTSK
jgi:carbamoyl-phosphate synthase large subunit